MRSIYFLSILILFSSCTLLEKLKKEPEVDQTLEKELARLESIEEDYLTLREEYVRWKKRSYATEKGLRDLVYRYDSLNQAYYELRDSKDNNVSSIPASSSNAENVKLRDRIQTLQKKVWDLEMELDKEYVIEPSNPDTNNENLLPQTEINSNSLQELNIQLVEEVAEYLNNPILLITQDKGITLRIPADYLFHQNQTLSPEGGKFIFKFAKFMRDHRNIYVNVIGHSDSQGTTKSNWDISLRRATSVVESMINGGCNPLRITASGRGQYDELVANNSDENRALNRRIEIILSEYP